VEVVRRGSHHRHPGTRRVPGSPSGLCHAGRVAGEFDDIRQRLEAIGEELADLAMDRLRESIDAGGDELPVDERRLTRARRAVEKAAAILREPDDHVYD
jgi:hypothetical protein